MANEISSGATNASRNSDAAASDGRSTSDTVSANLQSALDSINREEYSDALEALNRAIIDANQIQLAECFALRGFVRLRLEQFEHAEDDCTQSIKRRGNDPETLTWRAAARAERENWRGAFEDLDLAQKSDITLDSSYDKTMQNYLPAAEATFERRLQGGQRLPQAYYDRGCVYLFAKKYDGAAADFDSALTHDENYGLAYVGQARVALHDDKPNEAIRLTGQAMQLAPEAFVEALACRAEAYAANGQLAMAIEDISRLREKIGDSVEGLLRCARLRTRVGDLGGAVEDLNIAEDLNPNLPVILSLRGGVFSEMRNYEMATRDFIRYLKRVPGDERAWLQLGDLHLKKGEHEEARAAFDHALQIDDICAAAYVGRCKVLNGQHNHTQALVESERALRLDSRNPDVAILRGRIFHAQGRSTQADAEYAKALKLTEDRSILGEVYYLRGVSRYEAGNAAQAIEDFNEASRLRPNHAGTHVWRAATSAKLEEWTAVIDNLQKAIRLRPSAAQQYRQLGSPVATTAIKHFEKLIREGKVTADLMKNRGRANQFLGNNNEAIADYTVALKAKSEDFETMISRSELYLEEGSIDDAMRDLAHVIKHDPENARAYFVRAHAMIENRKGDVAMRDINRAIDIASGESRYHVLRGDLNLVAGNIQVAIEDYTQAIVLDPADHLAFRKRGSCYNKLSQQLYAIADLTRSNELFPGLAETLVLRGQAYLKNEQLDLANDDYEQALTIDPKQVKAFAGRANYLAQIGRHEEALILLTKAMQRFREDDRRTAELLMMRGKIFYQMGRFPPALTDFSSVISLRREDKFSVAAARCARAVVLVQHGELIRAKKEFDRVLKRFPEHPVAKAASDWLQDGNGPRPAILMPPDRMIRPTRPPEVRDPLKLEETDPKWEAEPPYDLWVVRTMRPREYGPVTKAMLDDWVRQGRVGSKSRLLRCGWEKWRKAKRVYPELDSEKGEKE